MGLKEDIREKLPPDSTIEEDVATLDDDAVFDLTNLPFERTGVRGILFLSTAMAAHDPRVKYFIKTGSGQPSFSVSISETPRVLANSLPERDLDRAAPGVIAWVKLNHAALLDFWNEGQYWTHDQVSRFIDGLKKIPATS